MPLIKNSSYPGPPFYQFNSHLQTILPALIRKVKSFKYERERFTLSDGDFLDLDWIDSKSKNLVILSHGLEGNSDRHYVKGMAQTFKNKKWDVLAWNCRSCSGEMNRKMRMYNHGEIGDLSEVINHSLKRKNYEKVVLIGFSMGGNINMKYLGVNADNLPEQIYKAVSYSAPLDLVSSVIKLDQPEAAFYKKRFLRMLEPKIKLKSEQFPNAIDFSNYKKIDKWEDFDNFFTAPLNGYKDAQDFYNQGSCINYISKVNIPTLIVNAINDPILTPECFPYEFCEKHPYLYLETPPKGGHVGFTMPRELKSWAEYRALEFIAS